MRVPLHLHGVGRAGLAVATALEAAGWAFTGCSGGSPASGAHAQEHLGAPWSAVAPAPAAESALILALPDDALPGEARRLAARGAWAGRSVLHLSGCHGLAVLAPLAAAGAQVLAWHPLRSFPDRTPGSDALRGCPVAWNASSAEGAALAESLARDSGARPFRLADQGRALYHGAAAAAGNGVLGLLAHAERLLEEAGVPAPLGREGIIELMVGALANARRGTTAEALTGPVVRDDAGVLAEHLHALESHLPEEAPLYRALCGRLLPLAESTAGPRPRTRRLLEGSTP